MLKQCGALAGKEPGRLLAKAETFTHNPPTLFLGGFMTAICLKRFRYGLVLAAAMSVAALSTPASAYTQEQQAACTGDAMQLCGPEIPDVDRVTACMIRNKARLSPGCRRFFRPGPEPDEAAAARPVGKPVNIAPAAPRKSAKAKKPKKPARPAST